LLLTAKISNVQSHRLSAIIRFYPMKDSAFEKLPSSEARFIDEKQLLARLPISRRTLFSWRASGKIPHVKIGRRILFHWPSCEAALLRYQHPPK
jgi:predicted DNA-binding transcriptional regulator AlpA